MAPETTVARRPKILQTLQMAHQKLVFGCPSQNVKNYLSVSNFVLLGRIFLTVDGKFCCDLATVPRTAV